MARATKPMMMTPTASPPKTTVRDAHLVSSTRLAGSAFFRFVNSLPLVDCHRHPDLLARGTAQTDRALTAELA